MPPSQNCPEGLQFSSWGASGAAMACVGISEPVVIGATPPVSYAPVACATRTQAIQREHAICGRTR
eukprot:2966593-Amphidinium_carterae.1